MRLTSTLPAVSLCDGGPLFPVIYSPEDGSDLWGPKKLGSRTHLPLQSFPGGLDCALLTPYSQSER